MPELDIFIDLTSTPVTAAALQAITAADWNMPRPPRRVTVAVAPGQLRATPPVPSGSTIRETSGVIGLKAALSAAGRDDAHLLVLVGVPDLDGEAVSALRQALERDTMFGFAVPRVGCADRCCVARLSRHGLGETSWLPRRAVSELPATDVVAEVAAPCVLIAARVAANFDSDLEYPQHSRRDARLHGGRAARRLPDRVV